MYMSRYLLFAVLCVVAIPLWYVGVSQGDSVLYPDDFFYEAHVFSVDNFFNEQKGTYTGEQTSHTTFTYRTLDTQDDVRIIENIFDVRTRTGDPIFAVTRMYGIDARTGAHVEGYGDKDRSGYLFAPSHIEKGDSFTYWHINYDGPALMEFVGEEVLFDLPVYKYVASYEGVSIDQTDQLTHLPGVPDERGIILEPTLTLWVEPTTGKMVAYEDETTAYYYDQNTRERLAPWNTFSNSLTEENIQSMVASLRSDLFSMRLRNIGVPIIFVLGALVLFALYGMRMRYSKKERARVYKRMAYVLSALVLVGGAVVIVGWFIDSDPLKSVVPGLVTMKFSTALSFLAASAVIWGSLQTVTIRNTLGSILLPIASLVLFMLMGVLLIGTFLGVTSGIESVFIREAQGAVLTVEPGRPSVGTMINFISIACVGLVSMIYFPLRRVAFFILGVIVVGVSTFAIVGYVFAIPALYYAYSGISSAMAFHTALFFLLLGISTLIRAKLEHQNESI